VAPLPVPVFREVNLRIYAAWRALKAEGEIELFCEGSVLTCTERVRVTPADYEAVLAQPGGRLVLTRHRDEADRMTIGGGEYLVVVR
jgi:hypothetical protein